MTTRLVGLVDELFGAPMREKKAKEAEAAKQAADIAAQVAELQKRIRVRERVLRQEAGAARKQKIDAAMTTIQSERAARGKRTLDEASLRSKAAQRARGPNPDRRPGRVLPRALRPGRGRRPPRSKNRLPLRVHDLRGFFITYALAGGATETWVMDRTGHKSSTMVNRYRRVARTVAEARAGSPTPLHLAIPELAAAFTAANAAAETKKETPRRSVSARNRKTNGPVAQSVELRTFNP